MKFISTNYGGFDTSMTLSKCLPIEHDTTLELEKDKSTRRLTGGVIKRNPLAKADLSREKTTKKEDRENMFKDYLKLCETMSDTEYKTKEDKSKDMNQSLWMEAMMGL